MTSLVRMELLKLAKRPMTWVLAILLHGIIGLGMVGGFLELRGVDEATRNDMLDHLTLPGIIPWMSQTEKVMNRLFYKSLRSIGMPAP